MKVHPLPSVGSLLVPVLLGGSTAIAGAQPSPPPVTLEPLWPAGEFVSSRAPLELSMSRSLDHPRERLALVIGTLDASALVEVNGTRVRYRPQAVRLASGPSEVVAYLVTGIDDWQEVGRYALNVRLPIGLDEGRIVPSADLSSTGQLDQNVGGGAPPPDRRTYQDFTLRLGLASDLVRDGWQLTTQANGLGVSHQTQRLRWNERQWDAPAIDLTDYRLELRRGPAGLSVGNISAGSHRYLINGFSSRGVGGGVRVGHAATFDAAVMNGTNVVGWDNLLGLREPSHRLASLALALELLPDRPGAMHVGLSMFDGSLLPRSSFNQGGVTDAETSNGFGVHLELSDASQRIRLVGGFAQSRFTNPLDPLLSEGTEVVAVRTTTRTARYGEVHVQLLQARVPTTSVPASLGIAARHENVEPLYRSVGAYVGADIETNGLNLTGSLGPVSLTAAVAGSRDNLAGIASILTTKTRNRSASGALPLGGLIGSAGGAWYWPALTVNWQQTHQYGDGVPVNGEFAASHVPDQLSTNQTVGLTWNAGVWNLDYSWNRSFQDNRQAGREQADFRVTVHGISLRLNPMSRLTSSIDVGTERQEHVETGTTQRLERIGGSAQLHVLGQTTLSAAASHSRGSDPYADQRTRNTLYNVELSQGFTAYGSRDRGTQGRLFVRYARTHMALLPFDPAAFLAPETTWTLNAGVSFRLY